MKKAISCLKRSLYILSKASTSLITCLFRGVSICSSRTIVNGNGVVPSTHQYPYIFLIHIVLKIDFPLISRTKTSSIFFFNAILIVQCIIPLTPKPTNLVGATLMHSCLHTYSLSSKRLVIESDKEISLKISRDLIAPTSLNCVPKSFHTSPKNSGKGSGVTSSCHQHSSLLAFICDFLSPLSHTTIHFKSRFLHDSANQ